MNVDIANIPSLLTDLPNWVLWQDIDGRKIPLDPKTLHNASSSNPATWSTFEQAVERKNAAPFISYGLGFVFMQNGGIAGIDLDGCRDTGTGALLDWAQDLVDEFDSYTEVSPSGTGIKIFIRGQKPDGAGCSKELGPAVYGKSQGVEVYDKARFFTVTGQRISEVDSIENREDELTELCKKYWPPEPPPQAVERRPVVPASRTILPPPGIGANVLERAALYVSKIPGGISGQQGSLPCFQAAQALVRGFMLTDEQALQILLHDYNPRCQPPWPIHQLQHKIQSARTTGQMAEGKLLNASPEHFESLIAGDTTAINQPVNVIETIDGRRVYQNTQGEYVDAPSFAGMDAAELEQYVDQPVNWLVENIFAADQPTLLGAKSKACKTIMLIDLAVSLATATNWLDSFEVPRPQKVLFITGEASPRNVSKKMKKALDARELGFLDLAGKVRVETYNFPRFANEFHRQLIQLDIQQHGIDVLIVDPVYRGFVGLDAAQVSAIGDAVVGFNNCHTAAVILSHHVTKPAARMAVGEGPPQLEDLAGAGFAEAAGNWWLIGRNEKYAFDGEHDLCVEYGSRENQGGAKRIEFNENNWTWNVSNQAEKTERDEARVAEDRENEIASLISRAEQKIKVFLSGHTEFFSAIELRDTIADQMPGVTPQIVAQAMRRLSASGVTLYEKGAAISLSGRAVAGVKLNRNGQ